MVEERSSKSVVGVGGAAGATGSVLMAEYAVPVFEAVGTCTPIFVVTGIVHLLALLVFQRSMPRIR